MGTMYGYTRVSTDEQNEALQRIALLEYGVSEEDIFAETISGAIAPEQRPRLSQLLEKLSPQDRLVVWKLDRLGRSALDMLQLDRTLQERQVKLISITEGLDTHTPIGKFYYAILASLAQMERARPSDKESRPVCKLQNFEARFWGVLKSCVLIP